MKDLKLKKEFLEKILCFILIYSSNNTLRACIGTILPYRGFLYNEIIKNVISASIKEPRFDPIKISELENINLSVDILSKPIVIKNINELDPKKFGIIVSYNELYNAVLLPI